MRELLGYKLRREEQPLKNRLLQRIVQKHYGGDMLYGKQAVEAVELAVSALDKRANRTQIGRLKDCMKTMRSAKRKGSGLIKGDLPEAHDASIDTSLSSHRVRVVEAAFGAWRRGEDLDTSMRNAGAQPSEGLFPGLDTEREK